MCKQIKKNWKQFFQKQSHLNIWSWKCPVGEMFGQGNVLVGKCSIREVSSWGIVSLGKCPSGKCLSGKCQSGICPRGSFSRGNVHPGKCPCTGTGIPLWILRNFLRTIFSIEHLRWLLLIFSDVTYTYVVKHLTSICAGSVLSLTKIC